MKQLYRLALKFLEGIGDQLAKTIVSQLGEQGLEALFESEDVGLIMPLPYVRTRSPDYWKIQLRQAFARAQQEWEQMERLGIEAVFFDEPDYPALLSHCKDSPYVLFYRGQLRTWTGLPALAVVGTRRMTTYGQRATEYIIEGLQAARPVIISGLAIGIDATAHQAALAHQLPTVAVLAHGLDRIYPLEHRRLSQRIVEEGGALLSEFPTGTKPDKEHFPRRNRIIAGLAEATLVVESALKGGALLTAQYAFSYDREVFAVPGRIFDQQSQGCLKLIQDQVATPVMGGQDIIQQLRWQTRSPQSREQKIALDAKEQQIYDLLRAHQQPLSAEEIAQRLSLPLAEVFGLLTALELKGKVHALPGQRYTA